MSTCGTTTRPPGSSSLPRTRQAHAKLDGAFPKGAGAASWGARGTSQGPTVTHVGSRMAMMHLQHFYICYTYTCILRVHTYIHLCHVLVYIYIIAILPPTCAPANDIVNGLSLCTCVLWWRFVDQLLCEFHHICSAFGQIGFVKCQCNHDDGVYGC